MSPKKTRRRGAGGNRVGVKRDLNADIASRARAQRLRKRRGDTNPRAEPLINDEVEVSRLAALPRIECDRQLRTSANRLGCSITTLRQQVEKRRSNRAGPHGQGNAIELSTPEPWPEPVNGAALLDELVTAIRRHVVLGQAEAIVVALWVVAVHAFDAWRIFPRLFVTAPERRCGKTTLLDVIEPLLPKPLKGESITSAALFRVIEAHCPTLLLDEADHYRRDNEELRAVINSGHTRGGSVIRNAPMGGNGWEPRRFSTWAPMVLAAIGGLWPTVEDRAIKIHMRRKSSEEHVEGLSPDRVADLERLARMAARWVRDHMDELTVANPPMPTGIVNREADNWRPLIAVKDAAGSDARTALIVLADRAEESQSHGEILLTDLRRLFDTDSSGVLFTRDILGALANDETRAWSEYKGGKPLTEAQLAGILGRYGIKPRTVRRGMDTGKGYNREWFDDAFRRYLPRLAVTPSHSSNSAPLRDFRAVTTPLSVTAVISEKPSVSAGCDGVTPGEPLFWANDIAHEFGECARCEPV